MTPHPRTPLLLVAALAALLGACRCETASPPDGGAEDAGPGPDTDAGRDASVPPAEDGGADAGWDGGLGEHEYCPALARARCDRERRCRFLDDEELPTCLAWLEAECLDTFVRVRAGAVGFAPRAALDCVGAASTPRCIEGPRALAEACDVHRVFPAAGGVGTACVDSQDCVSGFCFGTARQCHACRPFRTSGQSCTTTDLRCDPAATFCPPGSGARTCTALRSDGVACGASGECLSGWCNSNGNVPSLGADTCGRVSLGSPCGDPGDCFPGAWCRGYAFDGVTVTPGVCTVRTPAGEPCSNEPDDDGCAGGGTCLDGRCVTPAPYSLDAGAECEGLTQCEEPAFCRGLEAAAPDGGRSLRSGTCTARLPAGSPCDFATYVDTDCDDASTCGLDGLCTLRASTDGGCQARFECRDFLSCSLATGRCTPFLAVGAACDSPGLVCTDGPVDALCVVNPNGSGGTCVPRLIDGASCLPTTPAECASARCFATDAGGSSTCQPACFPP